MALASCVVTIKVLMYIMANIHRPMISYGFNSKADIRAINITQVDMQMHFDVLYTRENPKYNQPFSIQLNLNWQTQHS